MRLFCALLFTGGLLASTPSVWEMSSFPDFIKGRFENVSLGRDGRMTLAPKLDMLFNSQQPAIWSVASAPDGSLYAATGHGGRVFRIDPAGKAQLIWTAGRPEVFAIAIDKFGAVYAASSPDGKIYRIARGQATEYFAPRTTYIWALAVAPDGALFAGTGEGKVFRIAAAGKGEEYYATGQGNVTGLAFDAKGNLLAGTEPNGILYRITAKNKAFALYDSSLPEIRTIAQAADGSIYAVGLGGALAKKVQAAQQQNQNAQGDTSGVVTASITVTADAGDFKPPEAPKPQVAVPSQTQTAVTSTLATGAVDLANVEKSAIYRINPDNTVDTLWSSKEENVYDILPAADGLYFATDVSGRIYRLSQERKLTLIAQTEEAEVVRLLSAGGAMLAATANMGRIYRLGTPAATGTYESPVFDAGGIARWGKIRWQGAGPVAFRTRSGNSLRPDATWSDWSEPLTATGSQIAAPNARYLQFEASLNGAGAELENVSAAYLQQNNPPLVRSITVLTTPAAAAAARSAGDKSSNTSAAASVPYSITVSDSGDAAPTASTGTPTQTLSRAVAQQLTVSWQADDPDNDKLVYQIEFRGDGEREWKLLKKGLHDNTFTIDGDALADGRYLFRVTASDREVNPADSAKEADLVSSPVLIDNTPPAIRIQAAGRGSIAFEAQDQTSALKRAEWSFDAGPWNPLAPVDGILDSLTEQFRFTPEGVPPGEHVVVIRVVDSGNNTALARVVLR